MTTPRPDYIPLTDQEIQSLRENNNVPPNYVMVKTAVGGVVFVNPTNTATISAYQNGTLTGGAWEAAAGGVWIRGLPNIASPYVSADDPILSAGGGTGVSERSGTIPRRSEENVSVDIKTGQVYEEKRQYAETYVPDGYIPPPKVDVKLAFPINIKIIPSPTIEQKTSWQYEFDVNIEPIKLNISEPLISASFDFLRSIMDVYVDEERELKTLLNYGDDKQTVALAYRYGPLDNSGVNKIQLKLLQPIPDEVQVNTPVFLSREVAKTLIDKIRVRFAPPIDATPYLRPKNLAATADMSLGKSLNKVTLKLLALQTGSVSAEDLYKNKTFEDQIFRRWYSFDFDSAELNLNFTDYNDFVFYGSAAMRLAAFREKLRSIESIENNRIQFLSSSVYSAQTSSAAALFIQEKSAQYAKEKEDIIRAFDRYEQHLYFGSGSEAPYSASAWYSDTGVEYNPISYWPKIGNQIAPVYSEVAEEWYGAQLEIARRYDEFNENNLVNSIPTHVREHEDNSAYITFVTMIGHFFDTLKPYVDHFPYMYDRGLNPNEGLSKDLINEIAEAVGFTMPTVNSIYNLTDNILGTEDDTPRRDLTAEIYKRLLHNLPFFVKSKGSRTSLQTLINVLGFSNTLISIKETGIASSGSFYIFEEFSNGLYFGANTSATSSGTPGSTPIGSSAIEITSEAGSSITTETGISLTLELTGSVITSSSITSPCIEVPMFGSPRTLQLHLALDTKKFTTIVNSDIGWEIAAVPHPSVPTIGKVVVLNSSGSVVMGTPYEEIFNNELFSLALRSSTEESSLRVTKTEQEDIFFDSFVTESGSFNNLWENTTKLYIGAAGAFFGSSSFVGTIDEVRLWNDLLSDEMIVNTAFDPGSNAGDTYTSAVDSLLLQLSFNKINTGSLATGSILINEAPSSSIELRYISASNVTTGSIARFNRTIRQLVPTVGVTSYVSNKIKIINPPKNFADKNGVKRLHKSKSIFRPYEKRISRGRNKIVLGNSPTEIINQNIIRNFGIENINTALGVPTTLYKNFGRSLEALRRYYNRYYYVDVDINQYIRVMSEVSSVLDQVVDYFIPSRASLLKGIIIEQSMLEQTRIPPLKDARFYGNNTRRTDRTIASLTSSTLPPNYDYSATYTVKTNIDSEPELFGKRTLLETEIDRTISFTATKSLITGSLEMLDNPITGDISQLSGSMKMTRETIIASDFKTVTASIDLNFYEMNKIPYNDKNYGSAGAEPFDRIYPRKLLGLEIEKDRYGGTRSIYLPALYDIPPRADFRDMGVYTFFNHPEGIYKFPIIKKKLAYIRPLNQTWNYEEQRFEGITTWSYGQTYNIFDVVVQDVKPSDTGSISAETIVAARPGNKLYYAFTTRPSYVAPDDGTRYYSGSVPAFLPPSLDRNNWELIRFIPEVELVPKRVIFDTFTVPDPVLTNYKLTTVDLESAIDFPNRFVDTYNVNNIGANFYAKGEFIVQNIAQLLALQSNTKDIRIRLYRNIAARDADVDRPINVQPSTDSGLLIDLTIDTPNVAQVINPVVTLLTDEEPLQGRIYYTINNLTSVDKIGFVVSLYYFAIEINRRVPWGYLRKHYRYFRDNSTATKRRNYLGCKNTIKTTIDGLPPVQVFYGEGTDLVVAPTQTNNEIITGGGGQLNVR